MKSTSAVSDSSIDAVHQIQAQPDYSVLHEIFEMQADLRPESPAVVWGNEQITYAELESRANRLAHRLRRLGVTSGSQVAMLLRRSIDAYASLLGILKAGAAYVPIDPDYPTDRVAYILENSRANALVTVGELAGRSAFGGVVVRIDGDRQAIAAESAERLPREEVGVRPHDLCYVIYTSGSTGRPKGVMVEHRNVCNLVRAEARIYGVRSDDRVHQGASLSFDLSVEEVWLAFHSGATLVAATQEVEHGGPDLIHFLRQHGVTVLSCVPTLLAMLDGDVPELRLIILGGEACPTGLVERWARPGRRILNTYGPTETTVIATCVELLPGKLVTIGRPVDGYRVYLLDAELRPVPHGRAGEICIGGAGVARGYVGLPDETHARFVRDPFAISTHANGRLYRTGDVGRLNDEGNIEFLGRADAQVKLRGFRVELAEIESVMLEAEGVLAAACVVREDMPGVQQLVGYAVHRAGGPVDEQKILARLRSRLPAYMVPAFIETVPELPRLPSGKLDRAALPPPRVRDKSSCPTAADSRTSLERRVADVWEPLFHPLAVSVHDDFFSDLGGHSLLAARMVSELRKDPRFASVSMIDVYRHPTIASLACAFDFPTSPPRTLPAIDLPAVDASAPRAPSLRFRHFIAGTIQSAGLYLTLGCRGLQWVTPYLVYFLLLGSHHSARESAVWAIASAVAVFPALLFTALSAKWLLLGRIQPGHYPLWGWYYLRWWFVRSLVDSIHLGRLGGTPLLPFVYRLFGARIGRDVYIATDRLAAFDLISVGDGSSVDERAALLGYTVKDGELLVGPVRIGRDCFVGTRAILREYTTMEDGARLEDLSMLPRRGQVPASENWAGSPARRAARLDPDTPSRPSCTMVRRAATAALYTLLLLLLPAIELISFVPGVIILTHLDILSLSFFLAAPLVGALFVILLTAEVAVLKWLLVGRVSAGTYPVHGRFYIRNWLVDRLLALSLEVAGQLHATLYLAPWYRILGARLGRFVELSTASSTTPDLLEMKDGATVADEVSLGAPHVEGGWMIVAPTRLGRRAFVGNSAVVPAGMTLGDGSLIGVLSIAPSDRSEAARSGASWLGSPPILLPHRQRSKTFSERRTYCPPLKLRLARGVFEILRVTLPPAGFIIVTAAVIEVPLLLLKQFSLGSVLLFLPAIYATCCFTVSAAVAIAKWVVIGRYRPFERPLWSFFVWRLELVNALYEFLATPLLLEALQGTPLLAWYLRLLGARVGRGTYIETTGFLEWDLVRIGDGTVLNKDCILQTHLFEDRVLKASWVRIGADCEVGVDSVVLYDSEMRDWSRLDALSLLMKGETLPAGTMWAGSPLAFKLFREGRCDAKDSWSSTAA